MLITRTPLRISLCGGGTDFPNWFSEYGGLVVGGAINKYAYLTVRHLPPFHEYRSRAVYSRIEQVDHNSSFEHKAIKACIERMGMEEERLEIFHAADMPGRSGTGSSSSFVVGLLNGLSAVRGIRFSPYELASEAMRIEQGRLGEVVGCQDQVFAAHGGLNVVRFAQSGEIEVSPIAVNPSHIEELERHLLLFFTGITRTSSDVAASYAPCLNQKAKEQFAMMRLAEKAIDQIYRKNWTGLGQTIDSSWRIKAGLSDFVSNREINDLYTTARLAGAFGGKITGAGGGGCMLLVAPPEKHEAIFQSLARPGLVHIPFRFEFWGSSVIFCGKEK